MIIDDVARVSGGTPERIAGLVDADLVERCGLDSIQVLEVWATLERRFGLADGALGVSQPLTVAGIAAEVTRLRDRAEDTGGHSCWDGETSKS